jgi:hypothetical protein
MIKSLLESGQLSISGTFDFEWWRSKGHIPARIFVPCNLHIHKTHHIVAFRNQGWSWPIGECAKEFCDLYPVEKSKLIVLTVNSIPETWDVFWFKDETATKFLYPNFKSISTSDAYELMGGNLLSTAYFALNKKSDDPKTEVIKAITY